jgi:prepilin-type N-terminal cleavage/methylation domain-containing protein
MMNKNNHGFTLAEILVAVGIMAFALCGLLQMFSSCSILVSLSKNTNIATNAALGIMEQIRTSTFARIYDDYDGLNFIANEIPASRGVVYVDNSNLELLKVTISVCWRQGNRMIGEDTNLNGTLDAGEDANNNGIIDSPVQLVTLIANR